MSADDPNRNNPFASPRADSTPGPPVVPPGDSGRGRFAPCPHCGWTEAREPSFTWWGGLVGHKLLSHVICCRCGRGYNGKTGQSNTANIVLYQVVGLLIALAILALLFLVWFA